MSEKQLTIEDVIRQLNGIINNVDEHAAPPAKKLYINASQMAVVRKMMDAGALSNLPITKKEIYEAEEPNEVPQVQRTDNSK